MYIDKIYTKLYSERNWSGLTKLIDEIRSFAKMTHYTNSEGAKGIMRDGFKPGRYKESNASAFLIDDDTIRNDERYNMNTMMDNVKKRVKKYGWGAVRKDGKKMMQRNPYLNKNDVDNMNEKYGDENYYTKNPLSRYGTLQAGNFDFMYNDGGMNRHYPNNSEGDRIRDMRDDYTDTESPDGPSYSNGFGKQFDFGHRVTFPAGYKQISQIQGLGRGEDKSNPVYRVTFDTTTDEGIEPSWGAGNEVPVDIIDKDSQRLEIPRGMYKGDKRLKRGYINDFNDFDPSKFNTEDSPTNEAVTDIKKKLKFLNSSHGKKK